MSVFCGFTHWLAFLWGWSELGGWKVYPNCTETADQFQRPFLSFTVAYLWPGWLGLQEAHAYSHSSFTRIGQRHAFFIWTRCCDPNRGNCVRRSGSNQRRPRLSPEVPESDQVLLASREKKCHPDLPSLRGRCPKIPIRGLLWVPRLGVDDADGQTLEHTTAASFKPNQFWPSSTGTGHWSWCLPRC